MKLKHKQFGVLFSTILITLLFITLLANAAGGDPQTLFTNNINASSATLTITDMEQELLDRINNAATSIDLAIYEFDRTSIRDALIAAKNRGVTVRVVTDDDAYTDADNNAHFVALENAGIPVVNDNRSSIMHNKFFVVDGTVVWSGSTNITDNGFTLNNNNSIVFTSTAVADIYTVEFEEMFVAGDFGTAKTDNTTHTVTYNGQPLEIYFSPSDGAMDEVIAAVNGAQDSIDFSIFSMTHDGLRDALIARLNAGVDITAVWDALGAGNAFSDDETLCAAGAQIKIEDFSGLVHNKFMVIDANGVNPVLITGSMNWSNNGADANDENTLIYQDAATAQSYAAEVTKLYNALANDRLCPSLATGDAFVYLPIVIKPADNTLKVSGYVRDGSSGGSGIGGVPIYRTVGIGPETLVATTNGAGYYELPPLDTGGSPAAIKLRAVLSGYNMTPTEHSWTYAGNDSTVTRDFVGGLIPAPPADIQITYILYNPDGDDAAGEYVQLQNKGGSAQNMASWTLRDNASHIYTFSAFTLQPGASVKVWTKSGANTTTDLYWGSGAAIWTNTGDTATLRNNSGITIDTCTYGSGGSATSCGN